MVCMITELYRSTNQELIPQVTYKMEWVINSYIAPNDSTAQSLLYKINSIGNGFQQDLSCIIHSCCLAKVLGLVCTHKDCIRICLMVMTFQDWEGQRKKWCSYGSNYFNTKHARIYMYVLKVIAIYSPLFWVLNKAQTQCIHCITPYVCSSQNELMQTIFLPILWSLNEHVWS